MCGRKSGEMLRFLVSVTTARVCYLQTVLHGITHAGTASFFHRFDLSRVAARDFSCQLFNKGSFPGHPNSGIALGAI